MVVDSPNTPIPDFPLAGADAWVGPTMMANPRLWLYELSANDVQALEIAAKEYLESGRNLADMTKESFALGNFQHHVEKLRHKLLHGVGVEVLRGLSHDRFDDEMMTTVFCGIGAHLGIMRPQNRAGDVLGHVKDTGLNSTDPNVRIYQTSERQTFHTDSADVVGLLCLREAKSGGDSLLVSAASIFNRMWQQRPDLARLLFEPLATDRRGEVPDGEEPYMEIPPLNWFDQKLTVFYQRQYIDSAQRFPGAKPLTSAHVEALDLFDALANDPALHFSMRLSPGDMQFVYNHAQLHDRTAFVDWPEEDRRRHLLRLWLSIPGDRQLPICFKERYGSIEPGKRGGVMANE